MEFDLCFGDLSSKEYVNQLCQDLKELLITAGPSRMVAKISKNDPRISDNSQFPMVKTVNNIINRINESEKKINLQVKEHHGNLVIYGGVVKDDIESMKQINVVLTAHLDEISYLIAAKEDTIKICEKGLISKKKCRRLQPLCNPPSMKDKKDKGIALSFTRKKAEIYGFRMNKDNEREFISIGSGTFLANYHNKEGKWLYYIDIEDKVEDVREGDVAIQDYFDFKNKADNYLDWIIESKALDDRVGAIACIYAVKELVKRGIPAKCILSGDEEGVAVDISWARLIWDTFKTYCKKDDLILISDGIDGSHLTGEPQFIDKKYVSEALVIPFTSEGKGGGCPGVFALFRDEIIPHSKKYDFAAKTTTAYVGRSTDPKLMDFFGYIGFIDWTNGRVDKRFTCHILEQVKIEQIINMIGLMAHTVNYLNKDLPKAEVAFALAQ